MKKSKDSLNTWQWNGCFVVDELFEREWILFALVVRFIQQTIHDLVVLVVSVAVVDAQLIFAPIR